jgi:hypothetical protein
MRLLPTDDACADPNTAALTDADGAAMCFSKYSHWHGSKCFFLLMTILAMLGPTNIADAVGADLEVFGRIPCCWRGSRCCYF